MRVADPFGNLGRVGHRRRQTHQRHVSRRQQNCFLPGSAALRVAHVVDFVEDDRSDIIDACSGDQHVPEHLRRHHEDGGDAVDDDVARQQADLVVPPDGSKVPVLLIAERLDRRRVNGPR